MSQEQWNAVDRYITDLLVQPDAALDSALRASVEAGLPSINVSPPQGKLLYLLARLAQAKKILEIGTLGGYSAIWMARALPADGKLITIEFDPKHARVARSNIERAGMSRAVELIEGKAIDILPKLKSEDRGPFDLIFIDADKVSTADYFEWAVKLSRPGGVIVVDNVVRKGSIVDANSSDEGVQGIRRFNDLVARDKRVSATAIQTVGGKGYDGLAVVMVISTS
jgi:predicted O-methyltransferase YrrM